jgi:predicted solute-binding protein
MSDEDGKKVGLLNRKLILTQYYHAHGYSVGHIAWMLKIPVSEASEYVKRVEYQMIRFRYAYGDSISHIAEELKIPESKVSEYLKEIEYEEGNKNDN